MPRRVSRVGRSNHVNIVSSFCCHFSVFCARLLISWCIEIGIGISIPNKCYQSKMPIRCLLNCLGELLNFLCCGIPKKVRWYGVKMWSFLKTKRLKVSKNLNLLLMAFLIWIRFLLLWLMVTGEVYKNIIVEILVMKLPPLMFVIMKWGSKLLMRQKMHRKFGGWLKSDNLQGGIQWICYDEACNCDHKTEWLKSMQEGWSLCMRTVQMIL